MPGDEPFPILDGSRSVESHDALRERAASALERGLDFIRGAGDELAKVRAFVMLEVQSASEGVDVLESLQAEDGSFGRIGGVLPGSLTERLVAGGVPDELLGSLEALSILADLRNLYSPCADRVVGRLAHVQADDGGWGEGEADFAESSERLFVSAMLAGFSGRTRSARPDSLIAACRYVSGRWSVERIRREGWPLVAAFSQFYTNVVDDLADVALPWCGRELERGLEAGEYSARETMRVLIYCDAAALPGTDFDIVGLLRSLLEDQADDGGWAPEEASGRDRVGPTLDAMQGLLRLCRALPAEAEAE